MRANVRSGRAVAGVVRGTLFIALCGLAVAPQAIAFMSERGSVGARGEVRSPTTLQPRFKITGSVLGLTPGKRSSLRLRVVNNNRFAIRVKSLAVRASGAPGGLCSSAALQIPKRKKVSLRVPAKTTAIATYPVALRRDAASACQLARWPLRFRGQAVRIP
ncbi:MAG: hypothetical protein M3198_16040 [Actinomycetota bacterium]|nr:hypothetical protein [Actinomycetota bacterium]